MFSMSIGSSKASHIFIPASQRVMSGVHRVQRVVRVNSGQSSLAATVEKRCEKVGCYWPQYLSWALQGSAV